MIIKPYLKFAWFLLASAVEIPVAAILCVVALIFCIPYFILSEWKTDAEKAWETLQKSRWKAKHNMVDKTIEKARRKTGGRGILDPVFRQLLARYGRLELCECKGRCSHGFVAIHCGACDLDYCSCSGLGIQEKLA